MNTFILLVIFATGVTSGGVFAISQEFNSLQTCETARDHVAKSHDHSRSAIISQGCFKK